MTNTISITIKNRSMANQAFCLFQALPNPFNIPRGEIYTNVYQRSPTLGGNNNDQFTFHIIDDYFAIYGTNIASPDRNPRISTLDFARATLQSVSPSGLVNGSTFHLSTLNRDGISPAFNSTEQTTRAQGAFTIQSDGTFDVLNRGNIYLGVGAKDPISGEVVPVQTYKARPHLTTVLYPEAKYYICLGNYEQGTVVDMAEMGRVLLLDFTESSVKDVTFTLNERNEFVADPTLEGHDLAWSSTRLF
ncbi:hypothetical protein V8F20_008071 [Naviculisporaceae sp. PSN 640]